MEMNSLTAMRTGIYVIFAVIVGVMLVGMLPGQLSNIASSTIIQTNSLKSGSAPEYTLNKTSATGNTVISGRSSNSTSQVTPLTPTNSSLAKTSQSNSTATTATSSTTSSDSTTRSSADAASPATANAGTKNNVNAYSDLGYYALWAVGIIVALAVYFVSKRVLG